MLETLLEHPFFLNRHRDAPLLNEREVFHRHLQQQGTSRVALWNLSGELIHVLRLLQMEKLRDVSQEEIHRAAQRWARQQRSNPNAHSYGNSASFFNLCSEEVALLPRSPEAVERARGSLINSATSPSI